MLQDGDIHKARAAGPVQEEHGSQVGYTDQSSDGGSEDGGGGGGDGGNLGRHLTRDQERMNQS